MIEYQNIFTQVQVQGPPEMGVDPDGSISRERTKGTTFSKLAGLLGNAQLGRLWRCLHSNGSDLVRDYRDELLGSGGVFARHLHARSVLVFA